VIKKHREAWKAFTDAGTVAGDLEEALVLRGGRHDESPPYVDARARCDALGEVAEEVKQALLETTPTTLAGALAVIRYVNGYNHDELLENEEYATLLTTIGNVIESFIGRPIGLSIRAMCREGYGWHRSRSELYRRSNNAAVRVAAALRHDGVTVPPALLPAGYSQ